jgi:hypothetical protein
MDRVVICDSVGHQLRNLASAVVHGARAATGDARAEASTTVPARYRSASRSDFHAP